MNALIRLILIRLILPIATVAALIGCVGAANPSTAEAAVSASTAVASDSDDGSDLFPGGFYLESDTEASEAVERLESEGDDASADLLRQISSQPTAIWLGEWHTRDLLKKKLARYVADAQEQGTSLVFVTYAIPNRDCGGYSAGGYDYDSYLDWNRTIADELSGTGATVLIEPDSLSMLLSDKCGEEAKKRLPLISEAVDILEGAGLRTYLDGGNSRWHSPDVQADLLNQAGIANANGFFTNVSNFNKVQEERDYAGKVSARTGWKHFVIDVSRNGNGWTGDWCNPAGSALGQDPHPTGGRMKLDALLWVKPPGLSDGTCNGGPAAGDWWEDYALDLVRNR